MKSTGRIFLFLLLAVVISGCTMPAEKPQATSEPEANVLPAVSVGSLAPALVEVSPLPGSQISADGEIRMYFNQPMDRQSVEKAISSSSGMSGSFSWEDDHQLVFMPSQPWPPKTSLDISIAPSARSEDGQTLLEPVTFAYQTADYLRLVQALPEDQTTEVDPGSAIVASFNQPVVPLGADPANLPSGFTISSQPVGRGEWLNTSTYIFYPQPALVGGLEYTVTLNPELTSVANTPLESAVSWRFVTRAPEVLSYSPRLNALHVRLDEPVVITFNQAMDPDSVEATFRLKNENQNPVSGKFSWSDDFTVMTFTPDTLFRRGVRYTYSIPSGVLSRGGTALPAGLERSFYAAMELFVLEQNPQNGGQKDYYSPVTIKFNAPIGSDNPEDFITVDPNVKVRVDQVDDQLYIYGNFEAEESYTITVGSGLTDIWGDNLGFDYSFTFTGAPLSAAFSLPTYQSGGVVFVNPDRPLVSAQVVNIDRVFVRSGLVSYEDYFYFVHGNGYEAQKAYQPAELNTAEQVLEIAPNRNQIVGVDLNSGEPLTPGLYWVSMQPEPAPYAEPNMISYAVVSYVQLVFKVSAADALVWAIDTRTGSPVSNTPIQILTAEGQLIASGRTDGTGLFISELETWDYDGQTLYAVLSEPGDQFYSLARSDWSYGISGWDFGYSSTLTPAHTDYYIYTDRPIYRPGDRVSFRVVAREAFNGRYQLPADDQVEIVFRNAVGDLGDSIMLPLSEFGTASGEYTLSENALPGFYDLFPKDERYARGVTFQVSEYRKPEIELEVNFSKPEFLAGEQMDGDVDARYYFDAPASGSEIGWNVYVRDSYFSLPGYKVGPADIAYRGFPDFGDALGTYIPGGSGVTSADGHFSLSFPAEPTDRTQTYTLETLVLDESGIPVSNRTTATLHPGLIYIGVKADSWVGQAETSMGFDIKVVDWNLRSAGVQNLVARFGEVTWEQGPPDLFGFPTIEKQVNVLSEGTFQSSDEGLARLAFTPAGPGVYQLEVQSGNAVTQLLLWVGGPGQASWPSRDNKQIELLADKDSYQPGEIATVFIPNPFAGEALALVTYERGAILDSQIIKLTGSGLNFPVPLTSDSAPNIYFTVTLLGTDSDDELGFRYGIVNLPVAPDELLLNVEVLSQPERAQPGEPVTLDIRVTDANGNPVEGEFSLAVVDEAVLALADRFEDPIEEAYYGQQRLGVLTGISLVADAELYFEVPGGVGGGGGDMGAVDIRSDFQDTAYWTAEVTTGADGTASVDVTLPDNLTTWQVLVRGLNKDTLVGEGISEVITTKPLLIRPVTPRFAVVGDQIELSAVVHNNTAQPVDAVAFLTTSGFELDEPEKAQQAVSLPAQGRVRVAWRGTVGQAEVIEALFSIEGGGLQDASTPVVGDIPVVGYLAPQAFLTSGVLDQGGEQRELVSVPRSFDPSGGSLRLELASSLAGVTLEGLEVIGRYENGSTEYTVSSFLPNLEMMLALQEFGLADTELDRHLDETVRASITKLQNEQQFEGGWGWYHGQLMQSSPTLSAYVLLGLVRAQSAGYDINQYVLENAVNYLTAYLNENPPRTDQPWEFDQSVLLHYVLGQAGQPLMPLAEELAQQKNLMSSWAQALYALLMAQGKNTALADTIFSDLQSTALRSATGVHWETGNIYWSTLSSDIVNNAIVLYALAQRDPASPLVADAVRYLVSLRDAEGAWQSSYGTAWSLMALTEVMRGTGELGGEFGYSATLNDNPFAVGQAGGTQQLDQVVAETSLLSLLPDLPNELVIQRDPGQGRLYYRAQLNVVQPVASVAGLNRGVEVSRAYYPAGQDCAEEECQPAASAKVGDLLKVRVTLNLPQSAHYLQVEDYIPAGTEILDLSLKTSQQGEGEEGQSYRPSNPYEYGWGWWYFGRSSVFDDHISWSAEYLPAGTYELTYTLVVIQPGIFQARPARAWQVYFPEVQGISAGTILEIVP